MSSRSTIYGTIAVSVAFVMELTLVPLLLPLIQTSFDLSISELAWVFNSYGLAVAAGVLVGGILGDTVATKRVFAGGVLSFAVGSIIVAGSPSYELMIAGRLLQGFGGGVFSPLIPVLLVRASPEQPGKVLIIWSSIAGYAAALAPLVFAGLFSTATWYIAFIGFAVVSLVALMVVQVASIEGTHPMRIKPIQTLIRLSTNTKLWLMYAYVFCTYGCITYYLFRIPLWLEENGFQIVSIGLVLSAMWLSFSSIGAVLRNKVDQPFVRSMLVFAPIFVAIGFQLAYFSGNVILLAMSSFLIGCGFACSNSPSTQLILRYAPRGAGAFSASLDITFARLGGVCAVAVLAQSPFETAVTTMTTLSLAAVLFAFAATKGDFPVRRSSTPG